MQYKVIKLAFKSPLHLGRGRSEYDIGFELLHSDTLKSALFAAALELGLGVEKNQNDSDSNPFLDSFRVSSAFPYYKDELFFPRPLAVVGENITDSVLTKKIKKIKWVGESYFKQLLKGEKPAIFKGETNEKTVLDKAFLNDKAFKIPFKTETAQRVTVNRTGGETENKDEGNIFAPYYIDLLYFERDAGLFFLLECDDKATEKSLFAALRHLGESGIGNDRSTGNGHFEVKKTTTIDFEEVVDANAKIAMSLFCPTEDDVKNIIKNKENANYQLVKRGGYLANPADFANSTLRKKSITMFAEGAVFGADKLEGKLVNLCPKKTVDKEGNIKDVQHPVWRDGRAIFLPIKIK